MRRRKFDSKPPVSALVQGNRVDLLHDGAECFQAMLELIARARDEVLLEMYWFASDQTGRRFAQALTEAAKRGVEVRVIYDSIGSLGVDGDMFDAMRAVGCHVHEYHPVAPWRRRFRVDLVNHRDHRKLLVVDGQVGMTGGINLGDPWASVEDGGQGFRDDMIRIEGPAAWDMREVFRRTWNECATPSLGAPPPQLADAARRVVGSGQVSIVATGRRRHRAAIRRVYLERIRRAKRRIDIANSYFVPDRSVRRALVGAAARGVEVRVLLPGESDVPAAQYAAQRLYGNLLAHGIRIFEFHGAVLHCKSAIVDERWCTVGTHNFDYRSLWFNLEVNAVVDDEAVAQALRDRFELDLARATPIDPHDWAFRPLSRRLIEQFFYLFRKLL